MATEAARLKRQKPLIRKRKNRLDTNRPSHGRTWQTTSLRAIPHPHLKTPMRLVDHLYFVAEHDDHRLALGTGHNKTVDSPD
jgi:hypothetical protein